MTFDVRPCALFLQGNNVEGGIRTELCVSKPPQHSTHAANMSSSPPPPKLRFMVREETREERHARTKKEKHNKTVTRQSWWCLFVAACIYAVVATILAIYFVASMYYHYHYKIPVGNEWSGYIGGLAIALMSLTGAGLSIGALLIAASAKD